MAIANETRTDSQIQTDVLAELRFEPRVIRRVALPGGFPADANSLDLGAIVRVTSAGPLSARVFGRKSLNYGGSIGLEHVFTRRLNVNVVYDIARQDARA